MGKHLPSVTIFWMSADMDVHLDGIHRRNGQLACIGGRKHRQHIKGEFLSHLYSSEHVIQKSSTDYAVLSALLTREVAWRTPDKINDLHHFIHNPL